MTHIAPTDQIYERRQIVARMGRAGEFRMGDKRYIIWKVMTFWHGPGKYTAAEFVRPADIDKEGMLRLDNLKPGQIVVTPGLIYQKIPMSGIILAEHMKKMKKFKPRDLVTHVKDTSGEFEDLGVIDLRTKH